jgi:hypothetical protein
MSGPTESGVYKLGRILVGYHKYHDYHHHNVYQLHEIITQNGFKTIIKTPYPWKMKPLFLSTCMRSIKFDIMTLMKKL